MLQSPLVKHLYGQYLLQTVVLQLSQNQLQLLRHQHPHCQVLKCLPVHQTSQSQRPVNLLCQPLCLPQQPLLKQLHQLHHSRVVHQFQYLLQTVALQPIQNQLQHLRHLHPHCQVLKCLLVHQTSQSQRPVNLLSHQLYLTQLILPIQLHQQCQSLVHHLFQCLFLLLV